jgi:transcriptional regulator with XRE-family HTH domain
MACLMHDPPDHASPSLLSVIRRWRFRQGMPIREIERRAGLSRNTIRKYLRTDTFEPVLRTSVRLSKLDPFAEKLSGWLQIEVGKSRKQIEHRPIPGAWAHAQTQRSRCTRILWYWAEQPKVPAMRSIVRKAVEGMMVPMNGLHPFDCLAGTQDMLCARLEG